MKTGAGSARAFVAAIALTMLLGRSKPAHAGGMEIPDHGTEALGRGGAFTAKADDPSALHHNVAGLAQQRGTRFLLNANIARSSLAFQRAGTYPGTPGDPATPWAGRSFPRAENQGGLVALPVVAITSDFGLPWATFALGTFPPSTIGGRVYPLVQDGAPSPAKAGTKYTPPLSGTEFANDSTSAAEAMMPSESRSHWMTAPPIKTLPSSAYSVRSPIFQATVVNKRFSDAIGRSPMFCNRKHPVP